MKHTSKHDPDLVTDCVIILEPEQLLDHGRTYVAHVIPDVTPVSLNPKERKSVSEGRARIRDHDLSLWRSLRRIVGPDLGLEPMKTRRS